jgi:hypothetical protein
MLLAYVMGPQETKDLTREILIKIITKLDIAEILIPFQGHQGNIIMYSG